MPSLPSTETSDKLLAETLHALQHGFTDIPTSTALAHVDKWYKLLIETGIPDFQDIARELGNLQSLITTDGMGFDGKAIGSSLSMLGAQTIQVADNENVDETLQAELSNLGDLLIKAGGDIEAHAGKA